jgi:two-component system, OmpR family, KDP operon response regulator KdpE
MTEATRQRILVVDDEPQIRQVLNAYLSGRGFDVREANDGDRALETFGAWQPDLVVTDLSMPRMGGISLCKEIRKCSAVPIIVLSVREEESTKVEALECGADDYVTKPFGTDELWARIRAALRRASGVRPQTTTYFVGRFRVDTAAHKAEIEGIGEVPLTPKEFELLIYLLENPGRVITQKALLDAIWGRAYSDQTDNVRALVHQLRKKIEPNPAAPTYLKTEPWVGYRFEPGE